MKVAVTGANGHLGRRLIRQLSPSRDVRAIVRRDHAKQTLIDEFGDSLDTRVVDYADADGLSRALDGCDRVIHLVGIIKESAANPFKVAHEDACTALVAASGTAGVGGIVHLSIVGADPVSTNDCLASRGCADEILLKGLVPASVIRVPMVLGEGDYAASALIRQAMSRIAFTFRASSREQPIYAGDVASALAAALDPAGLGIIELGGPESLTRRALIHRAAELLHGSPIVVSIPLGLGMMMASLLEHASNPPVTRAMLGVLDHDDDIDVGSACQRLSLELTPLDDTIRRIAGV